MLGKSKKVLMLKSVKLIRERSHQREAQVHEPLTWCNVRDLRGGILALAAIEFEYFHCLDLGQLRGIHCVLCCRNSEGIKQTSIAPAILVKPKYRCCPGRRAAMALNAVLCRWLRLATSQRCMYIRTAKALC